MNAPFPDVKPFPTSPNPRVAMGDNKPPLDQQVVVDFDEALASIDPATGKSLSQRIKELSDKGAVAPACNDAETAGRYTDTVRLIVAARKSVEEERETLNRPLLNAQRSLKGRADAIIAPLAPAEANLRAKIKAFDDAEKAKAAEAARKAAERKRQAEIAAENERRRLQAIADAQAKAERERLQGIADAAAAKEKARLQAIEDARAAEEAREAVVVEVKAEEVVVEAAVVEAIPVSFTTDEPIAAPVIQGDYGAKASSRTEWKHEILSIRQLPDSILKNEKVVEALNKVIGAQVRGGAREIKGCRIYSETSLVIR